MQVDRPMAMKILVAVVLLLVGLVLAPLGGIVVLTVLLTASEASACAGLVPGGAGDAATPSTEVEGATSTAINALRPIYEAGQQATGVPWNLLAAVDYRENNNSPDRSALSGEKVGSTNPDSGAVTTSKEDSVVKAGEHLKEMASGVYGIPLSAASSEEDFKHALLAYNRGHSYKWAGLSPDASPYVMNQFDEAHVNMRFPDIPGETLAGRVDRRLGAWTLFARLGGTAAAPGACAQTVPSGDNGTGGACPVPGGDVKNNWGDPRSGGRSHKGNDIGAPEGHPALAVFDATVYQVTNSDTGLGGISLWLRDDAGNTYYYAHNVDNVASQGQRVGRGELIAHVGSTGNADASWPHVHFEIHLRAGPAVDPYPTLTAWGCTKDSSR